MEISCLSVWIQPYICSKSTMPKRWRWSNCITLRDRQYLSSTLLSVVTLTWPYMLLLRFFLIAVVVEQKTMFSLCSSFGLKILLTWEARDRWGVWCPLGHLFQQARHWCMGAEKRYICGWLNAYCPTLIARLSIHQLLFTSLVRQNQKLWYYLEPTKSCPSNLVKVWSEPWSRSQRMNALWQHWID